MAKVAGDTNVTIHIRQLKLPRDKRNKPSKKTAEIARDRNVTIEIRNRLSLREIELCKIQT